ncbi:Ti-type conjugative transfer relaxase TraA, partial [Rhizobium sp. MJ21]|nr:Ti-type conjugative transfer relaxase TraA [Rhizobium sp. MJ21]
RMLAAGRERKEAVQAVPEATTHLRSLGAAYANILDAERKAITEERRRMAVAIPGLSKAAEEALLRLTSQAKTNARKRDTATATLDPGIRQEFADVSKALDERFGRNALIKGDKDLVNCVPPAQRRAFEAMQERFKVLQQTVRQQSSQQIVAQRRQHAINRGRGIDL